MPHLCSIISAMSAYEELLRKLGLLHLKDDPEKLQEAVLRELGLEDVKGDPQAMQQRSEEILEEKQKEFAELKKELGELIQRYGLKRHN